MQTLKTAIVVLLLMTVMYGSYVSLTTPPEPLPDAVAALIEESGSFGLEIDAGLPESLANLGDDTSQSEPSSQSAAELAIPDFAMPPSPQSPTNPTPRQLPGQNVAGQNVAGLSAPPMSAMKNSQTAVTRSLSDSASTPLLAANSSPNSSSKEQL